MKKAAEVFIIIGMILGFPMIIPLIVGGIALNKLDEAEDSSDITGIAILTIFWTNMKIIQISPMISYVNVHIILLIQKST